MVAFKIHISSWTASFRYPNLISGVQPTLDVPPLSTVLGLINAAAGHYINHDKGLRIGYHFSYGAKAEDLETIYQIEANAKGIPSRTVKTNVMRREFLFENNLTLYLLDESLVEYLRNPHYPLVLGRSNDLATVRSIEQVEMKEIRGSNRIKGQIVPFDRNCLPGKIQALPSYFSNTIPRQNLGTKAFSIIRYDAPDIQSSLVAYRECSKHALDADIYFHNVIVNE